MQISQFIASIEYLIILFLKNFFGTRYLFLIIRVAVLRENFTS